MTNLSDFAPNPGSTVRVYDRLSRITRQSKNLAATRHATKHWVKFVEMRQLESGNYGVVFWYNNGDSAVTTWADWRVALDWIIARRSWNSIERIGMSAPLYMVAATSRAVETIRKSGTIVHSY